MIVLVPDLIILHIVVGLGQAAGVTELHVDWGGWSRRI